MREGIFFKRVVVGVMEANCYIFGDSDTKEVFIIDPGGDAEKIKSVIDKYGLIPKAIINTHGHGDHISANRRFDLPIWIHKDDADFLLEPSKNLSSMLGLGIRSPQATRLLEENDTLNIGKFSLTVIHTPGHTPGSICLKDGNCLFTGDLLFADGVGRTDFPYGSQATLIESLKKIFNYGDDTVVYPGHGPSTTIGSERCRIR